MLIVACFYTACCCRLWNYLPSWLQAGLKFRFVRFAVAGLPVTLLGLSLYYVEVSHLNANEYSVRPVNWVFLTGLGFVLNWLVWRERQASKKQSAAKFYAAALACSVCSFGLFSTLMLNTGLQYMVAQCVTMATIGPVHYFVVDKGVFAKKNKTALP